MPLLRKRASRLDEAGTCGVCGVQRVFPADDHDHAGLAMPLTRVAVAMIIAAVFAVLFAPRQGPYVLEPVPAGDAMTIAPCHGEAVSIHNGVFHACRVP